MRMHFASNLDFLGMKEDVIPEISIERKQQLLSGEVLPEAHELLLISAHYNISIDRLLKQDLAGMRRNAAQLKLILFDVDGVMTDGGMYYTESGDEFKKFNAKDGLAIRRLAKGGFITGIVSHGINRNLIDRRASHLGISKVYAGNLSKAEVLSGWCQEMGITPNEAAYIGDDVNDLPIIRLAGFTACPADATDAVKNEVNIVLQKKGGEGCVREWIDNYIMQVNSEEQ